MGDEIKAEVEKMEEHMLQMEGEHNSMAFSGSTMLTQQIHINQSLLKIIKKLTDHPKEKDWV